MTEPNDKKEEARESPERVWITWDDAYPWPTPETGGEEYVRAEVLSSRDREIREVLEGLMTHILDEGDHATPHWCPISEDGISECAPACLAARELWEKVQPAKEGNSLTL